MTPAKFLFTLPASDVCQQAGSLFLLAGSRNKEALRGYVCTPGDHYLEAFQSQTNRNFYGWSPRAGLPAREQGHIPHGSAGQGGAAAEP